ncbi:MAG TPA: YIP1 family protein [Atribacteraceae bacterium]|nr:YIP1 family protein [Atribacteraceae bacterium]
MYFLRICLLGCYHPIQFAETLKDKPAPHWGFYAQLLRSMIEALLLYLPAALLRKTPPVPSYLTFIPSENYFAVLVWLTPLIFLAQWLLGAGVAHLFLRMKGIPSDIDQVLNITGMASLVVSVVLVGWDWLWFLVGGTNRYVLVFSHLLIDIWWFVLLVCGLIRLLGVSWRLALIVSFLVFTVAIPLTVVIMRSPF